MEAHIHEWLNLLVRWIHFIVGIAWIGASFYFNWLENNLDRDPPQEDGIAGNLWAVHGGGFYHLKKFSVGPETPATGAALVQMGGLYHLAYRFQPAGDRLLLQCPRMAYRSIGDGTRNPGRASWWVSLR